MHAIGKAAHWAFAAFMAVVAFFVSLLLAALLVLKLFGLQVGVQPPADFHPQIGTAGMTLMVCIVLFIPLAAATFVGAMTAPFAQRGLAAVVFPVLVFAAAVTLPIRTGNQHHAPDIARLLGMAASCAGPGGLVYIRWRRQRSQIAGA